MKKVIILVIIAVVGLGFYYFFFISKDEELLTLDFDAVDFREFDLSFSSLPPAQIPYIELEEGVGFGVEPVTVDGIRDAVATPTPSISFDDSVFDISSPTVNMPSIKNNRGDTAPESGSPSAGQWSPNPSDCSRFAAAPSCSYVPEANRGMCEECKKAGY